MSPNDKKLLLLKEKEEKKQLLKNYLVGGHRVPRTRREFLASGLTSVSATLMAPTLTQLVASSAWAQSGEITCNEGSDNSMPIFVHLQLAGGPALFANHLVTTAGGQTFNNYARLGMGPQPARNNYFANNAPFWVQGTNSSGSPLMNRVLELLANDMDIFNNAAFVSVAAASVDDTSDDQQDMSGMLEKAGVVGSMLPYTIVGSNRFKGAIFNSANLLRVTNLASIENSLGFKGALGSFPGSISQQVGIHRELATLIEDLNKYQVEQIAREPNSHATQKIFKSMVECASKKNTKILGQPQKVDIYADDYPGGNDLATVFAANTGNNGMNNTVRQAGYCMGACLSGMSAATLIRLGGYDYHLGSTRAQANAKDREAGDILGRILLAAKRRSKKVFIFVSSDGSVSSPNDAGAGEDVNWVGDLSQRGMAYMIAYDPSGAPQTGGFNLGSYADAPFQLNHFGSDMRVSSSNPLGSLDANELFTSAVFLNYLSFAGRGNLIDSPGLAPVKKRLIESLPTGAPTIQDYFTRIKS